MKRLFLAGGFAGFAIVFVAGFLADRSFPFIVRDACIGCLAGALLLRWFWGVLIVSFKEVLLLRRKAAETASAAAAQAQAQENANALARHKQKNPPQAAPAHAASNSR